MRVAELTGAMLDYWVAKAEELPSQEIVGAVVWVDFGNGVPEVFGPSYSWAQGGPIIDRLRIATDPLTRHREEVPDWQAQVWGPYACQKGPTALIAAMRAYVESIFGETVPDEVPA